MSYLENKNIKKGQQRLILKKKVKYSEGISSQSNNFTSKFHPKLITLLKEWCFEIDLVSLFNLNVFSPTVQQSVTQLNTLLFLNSNNTEECTTRAKTFLLKEVTQLLRNSENNEKFIKINKAREENFQPFETTVYFNFDKGIWTTTNYWNSQKKLWSKESSEAIFLKKLKKKIEKNQLWSESGFRCFSMPVLFNKKQRSQKVIEELELHNYWGKKKFQLKLFDHFWWPRIWKSFKFYKFSYLDKQANWKWFGSVKKKKLGGKNYIRPYSSQQRKLKIHLNTTFFSNTLPYRKRLQNYLDPYNFTSMQQRFPYKGVVYRSQSIPRYINYQQLFHNQLLETQTFRTFFRLRHYQLVNHFRKALKNSKRLFDICFIKYFEFRLDTIAYRAKFARSYLQARQYLKKGYFLINGKPVTKLTKRVTIGDCITPNLNWLKSKNFHNFRALLPLQADNYPNYMLINERIPAALIFSNPQINNLKYDIRISWQFLMLTLSKYR